MMEQHLKYPEFAPERLAQDWIGMSFRPVLSSDDVAGATTVVEVVAGPGSGPPRHIHRAEDEIFMLLSGEMKFWVEGQTFVRGAGAMVFIPRGAEHTFKVISDHPCRHYASFTPGGFEKFFAEMATRDLRIPEDMDAVIEAADRHNMTFTGPPL